MLFDGQVLRPGYNEQVNTSTPCSQIIIIIIIII
jgi:hypothetical protein